MEVMIFVTRSHTFEALWVVKVKQLEEILHQYCPESMYAHDGNYKQHCHFYLRKRFKKEDQDRKIIVQFSALLIVSRGKGRPSFESKMFHLKGQHKINSPSASRNHWLLMINVGRHLLTQRSHK